MPLYLQELSIVERSNRKQLMTRGEISQERREHAEKLGNVLGYSVTCFLVLNPIFIVNLLKEQRSLSLVISQLSRMLPKGPRGRI